jgi:hypothetical protein
MSITCINGRSRSEVRFRSLAVLGLVVGASASPVRAESATATLTYEAGTPGTEFHAVFAWTVTGVTSHGRFLDGSPWITIEPGAELVAVFPTSRRLMTAGGFEVTVDGSALNPGMMHRWDPQTLQSFGDGLQQFDSRRIFLSGPGSQAALDATFDHAGNIGLPADGPDGSVHPVPLQAGDVIVTARSQWSASGHPGWSPSGAIPHVGPYRRTAIDRFGVLTVLAKPLPPGEPHFRPPLQWPEGDEISRPAPIPLSEVIVDDSALRHFSTFGEDDVELLLTSPAFHDASGVLYQSSQAQHAVSEDPRRQRSVVYGGSLGRSVMRPMLLTATGEVVDPELRELVRNRLIQYGIDSFGATMCLGVTRAGAGQRAGEMKPWVLLAGWWLDRPEMRNPYQAIRERYAGTAVAGLDDLAIGRMLFHDDHVARQVEPGLVLGDPYHQVWGPDAEHSIVEAGEDGETRLADAGRIVGRFGRLNISGARPHWSVHARNPVTYYGCSLRIESGPGAGPTVYRVLEVGKTDGAIGEFIRVDRPWQHGFPGPDSTVRMFPFRNGTHVPELTEDVGRWYYSTSGQGGNIAVDCFSPAANRYARISFRALLVPYAALKRLADVTGDADYLRGSTWNWLSEAIGGDGRSLVDGQLFGTAPNAERINNQFWSDFVQAGLRVHQVETVRQWIAGDGGDGEEFGRIDRSRIPGTSAPPIGPTMPVCPVQGSVGIGEQPIRTTPGGEAEIGWIGTVFSPFTLGFDAPTDGIIEIELEPRNSFQPVLAVFGRCDFDAPLDIASVRRGQPLASLKVLFDATAGSPYRILVASRQPGLFGKAVVRVRYLVEEEDDEDGSAGDDDEDGTP